MTRLWILKTLSESFRPEFHHIDVFKLEGLL